MLEITYRTQFKKDFKKMVKRGKNIKELETVIKFIVEEVPLPEHYRDHNLIGNYAGRKECHIQPNWLLIYKIDGKRLILERTGTHSDLFNE